MGYPEAQYAVDEINDSVDELLNQLGIVKDKVDSCARPHGVQVFTSAGTFVVPEGVYVIYVTACGGGGGGGGGYYDGDYYNGGHGGNGAEAVIRKPVAVNPGDSIPITIGAGGTASAYGSQKPGGAGGATKIGTLLTLLGGPTGVTYDTAAELTALSDKRRIGGGVGGNGSNGTSSGDINATPAQDGIRGHAGIRGYSVYGAGGGGCLGNGGNGAYYYSYSSIQHIANATKGGYGAGGGGGSGRYSKAAADGGPGIAIIEW